MTERKIKIKNIDGRDYAYDMISYWDKKLKKYRKKSTYLGVVKNKETKEYVPKRSSNEVKFQRVVDVSTLSNTIAELGEMGVKTSFALVDAGYFSENNIKDLYNNKIAFVTRMPAGRTVYKSLITEHKDIKNSDNIVVYGKRVLYVKRMSVD